MARASHVAEWWREPLDLSGLEAKYGLRIDGLDPGHVLIILNDAAPIGWIQSYLWADYPAHAVRLGADSDSAGLDLAIGEPEQIGIGLGPAILRGFVREIARSNPSVRAVICDPETNNRRSVRAFEKAGFVSVRAVQLPDEDFHREVMRLDIV